MPYDVIQREYTPGRPRQVARETVIDTCDDERTARQRAADENNARNRAGRRDWQQVEYFHQEHTA